MQLLFNIFIVLGILLKYAILIYCTIRMGPLIVALVKGIKNRDKDAIKGPLIILVIIILLLIFLILPISEREEELHLIGSFFYRNLTTPVYLQIVTFCLVKKLEGTSRECQRNYPTYSWFVKTQGFYDYVCC